MHQYDGHLEAILDKVDLEQQILSPSVVLPHPLFLTPRYGTSCMSVNSCTLCTAMATQTLYGIE